MNPHFLFNAINTIHSFLNVDVKKTDDAILILADIYRYLMDKSFSRLIPFSDEWQFVKNYLEFEKLRFPDTFTFETKIKGNFGDIDLPPLLIQPLVENSIRHGLRKKKEPGYVKVLARRDGNHVKIEVVDNGIGIKTENLFSRTLDNIRDRLKYIYEESDLIIYETEDGEVKAVISFKPLKETDL